jgi:hypothetical protein
MDANASITWRVRSLTALAHAAVSSFRLRSAAERTFVSSKEDDARAVETRAHAAPTRAHDDI